MIEVRRREPCIGQNEEKNQQLEIDRADANRALSQHVFSSEKSQVNSQYFNHCQRMEHKRKEKENWADLLNEKGNVFIQKDPKNSLRDTSTLTFKEKGIKKRVRRFKPH